MCCHLSQPYFEKKKIVAMRRPIVAIIDNYGIVRESYYLALKELGFYVSILSLNWKDFNDKVGSGANSPDICLINIDSNINTGMFGDSIIRFYVNNYKIILYAMSEESLLERSEYVNVYMPFNLGPQK